MSMKSKLTFPLVSVATLVALAFVFILPVTFGVSTVGALWPLVPTVFFFTYAVTIIKEDATSWWGGSVFFGTFFLFYLLDHAEVMPFSRSWPFLILVIVGLIAAGYTVSKKYSKKDDKKE